MGLDDQVSVAIDGSAPQSLVALSRAGIVDDVSEHPIVVASSAHRYGGFDISAGSVAGPLVLIRLSITRWLLDGSHQ